MRARPKLRSSHRNIRLATSTRPLPRGEGRDSELISILGPSLTERRERERSGRSRKTKMEKRRIRKRLERMRG